MDSLDIAPTLSLLNHYLSKRGATRTFIICGGASLILQNIIARTTQDIDIVAPAIDQVLRDASNDVANELDLHKDWLNSDPKNLGKDMRSGWEERVIQVYHASNLTIFSISREDMIFSKFYAYCDRQKDILDLVALKPSMEELERAITLTRTIDGNPGWPEYVDKQANKLKQRLGYA